MKLLDTICLVENRLKFEKKENRRFISNAKKSGHPGVGECRGIYLTLFIRYVISSKEWGEVTRSACPLYSRITSFCVCVCVDNVTYFFEQFGCRENDLRGEWLPRFIGQIVDVLHRACDQVDAANAIARLDHFVLQHWQSLKSINLSRLALKLE